MAVTKSRRILFLQGSSGFGGSKGNLLDMVEGLRETVYQPVIACPGKGWLTGQLDQMSVPYVLLPFYAWRKWLERPRVRVSIRINWRRALLPWRIDLVHSNEFWWGPYAVLLGKYLSIPAIVHLRDGHHTLKKALQYKLDKAHAIIAVSTELRGQFAANQALHGKTLLVLDGYRRTEFNETHSASRRLLGLEDEEFAIGNAGKISERKNQRLLLGAMAQLKLEKRISKFKILFAGESDSDYMRLMQRDVQELGLRAEVKFLGLVKDMGAFFSAIDALVHCAVREGLPRVIPEAMLAKKPVIATAAEGIRDAIPGGEFGVVVPAEDQRALANEIERLSKNSDLRKQIAERAYERAVALFSLKAHSDQLVRVYDELIDGASIGSKPARKHPLE